MKGTVIWFSSARGFGFLRDDATQKEYFCHFTAIQGDGYRQLKPDQRVEFEVIQGEKGLQADNVKAIEG